MIKECRNGTRKDFFTASRMTCFPSGNGFPTWDLLEHLGQKKQKTNCWQLVVCSSVHFWLTDELQLETRLQQRSFYPGSMHKWLCFQSNQEGRRTPANSHVRTCQRWSQSDVKESLYANLRPAMPMTFIVRLVFLCFYVVFVVKGCSTAAFFSLFRTHTFWHTRLTAPKNISLVTPDSERQ